jgi:hypothetical protein
MHKRLQFSTWRHHNCSPLTHNISGTAKAAVQSALAFYIWGNTPTVKGVLGMVLVLFGSALYTYVQISDAERARVRSAVEDKV